MSPFPTRVTMHFVCHWQLVENKELLMFEAGNRFVIITRAFLRRRAAAYGREENNTESIRGRD